MPGNGNFLADPRYLPGLSAAVTANANGDQQDQYQASPNSTHPLASLVTGQRRMLMSSYKPNRCQFIGIVRSELATSPKNSRQNPVWHSPTVVVVWVEE
jgi:hypothetical protein